MQKSYEQPIFPISPKKSVRASSPQSVKFMPQEVEPNRAQQAINPNPITAEPSVNNSHVNKVKAGAFIVVFALFILVNSLKLSTCNINYIHKDQFCQLYLGYLITFCGSGLVYLLINVAIYCKGSDTINLACLSWFLFDNHQSNCCQGWTGVAIAIFIIIVAPLALVISLVTILRYWRHARMKEEERKGQESSNRVNSVNF